MILLGGIEARSFSSFDAFLSLMLDVFVQSRIRLIGYYIHHNFSIYLPRSPDSQYINTSEHRYTVVQYCASRTIMRI